jgi:hypothetical protein
MKLVYLRHPKCIAKEKRPLPMCELTGGRVAGLFDSRENFSRPKAGLTSLVTDIMQDWLARR